MISSYFLSDQDLPVQLVVMTLDWSNVAEELKNEAEGSDSKVEILLSRFEKLYKLVEEPHRRVYSRISMLNMVLRLLRKLLNLSYEKSVLLMTFQAKTIRCLGNGLSSL